MRPTFNQFRPVQAGTPITGTFFPDTTNAAAPPVLARVLTVVLGIAFLRLLARVASQHGGHRSTRGGRMERLAQLHRDLHAHDATGATRGEEVPA